MKNNYIVINESIDPCYNLALEEHLLTKHKEGTIVMLWQNRNTIVIGRHQNAVEEINQKYVNEHGIKVVRRTTGGGAVYHDLGNLNYSFITDRSGDDREGMRQFAGLVIRALEKAGVAAEFSGRNDIVAEGKKVSGTAQRICGDRILHHGCLLYDSNLSEVSQSLRVRPEKFDSKSVKSVRGRVANIKDLLKEPMELTEFKDCLMEVIQREEKYKILRLTDEEEKQVENLAREKYASWEWTYGNPIKCTIHNYKKCQGGTVEVYMNVKNGMIEECQMYGDFMALRPAYEVAEVLVGCRYGYQEVLEELKRFRIEEYFGMISAEEVALVICCVEE